MARKRKSEPAEVEQAEPAGYLLTYIGEAEVSGVCGYVLPYGEAVPVPQEVAERFAAHPQFEVSRGDVHEG